MIRFYRVGKLFSDQIPALAEVNFSIDKGEFAFLTGPSGAGKSTILKLAAGLILPTSGQVVVHGRNLGVLRDHDRRRLRRHVGVVFQDFKLLYDRSVFDNVAFALEVIGVNGRSVRSRVDSVLEWVGLTSKAKSMPHRLSGGEQQRVAIARAMVVDPLLVLADEPTGNLDDEMRDQVLRLFKDLHYRGTTILMATHSREVLSQFSQKAIHLQEGRIESTQF